MKRIIIVLLCVFCIFLSACSQDAESEIGALFQAEKVYFKYSGIEYEFVPKSGSFTVLNGGYEGMLVLFNEQGCAASCNGFSIQTKSNSFPPLKGFYLLHNAFERNINSIVTTDDGAYALLIDSSRFLVYYNTDIKKIEKLIAETADGVFEYTVLTSEETD